MTALQKALQSKQFQERESNTLLPLGIDKKGGYVFRDLREIFHILITGSAGSGKEVFQECLIDSLIAQNTPETLKLILIDPTMVNFHKYSGSPYLQSPIIHKTEDTLSTLRWCATETDRRFLILKESNYSNIFTYNDSHAEKIPVILVMVSEFSDLITAYSDEVDVLYGKIALVAKLLGIHFVLCTQAKYPVVFTDLIKNFTPTKIAFPMSFETDLLQVLGACVGAEKLSKGEMLFSEEFESAVSIKLQSFVV